MHCPFGKPEHELKKLPKDKQATKFQYPEEISVSNL